MKTSSSTTDWIRREFIEYKKKNANLSVRSFAKRTDIPNGRMSELLSGKRRLTAHLANKISEGLLYDPKKKLELMELIEKESKEHPQRKAPQHHQTHFTNIDEDMFYLISDWYHFAILNLISTRDFKNSAKWIAKRLAITTPEAQDALDRLKRLGLTELKNRKLRRTNKNLATTTDIPSAAIKRFHKQNLENAITALGDVPVELRDITSITMPTNPEQLQKAKSKIKKMRREISKILEDCDPTEVYTLNIQLIPLTKR